MSLSGANATALVRSLIKEATAKFWTDAEITLYLSAAMQSVWAKYAPFLFEQKKKWVDVAVTDGTADYLISTAIGTDVFKISKIVVKETGNKLRYVTDDELWKYYDYVDGDAVSWTYKGGGYIHLIPTPGTTDSDYLQCWYMTTYTDITSFPDSLQMVPVIQAVIYAKTKDEDVTPDLLNMLAWHEQLAITDLVQTSMGHVEVFPDYEEEEGLA